MELSLSGHSHTQDFSPRPAGIFLPDHSLLTIFPSSI